MPNVALCVAVAGHVRSSSPGLARKLLHMTLGGKPCMARSWLAKVMKKAIDNGVQEAKRTGGDIGRWGELKYPCSHKCGQAAKYPNFDHMITKVLQWP